MTGRILSGLLAAALAALTGGCTTESTPTTDQGPTGNPTLQLSSVDDVLMPEGGSLDGLCIEVPEALDPTIAIVLKVTELDLRPQGYCTVAGELQCGHLVVRVNGVEKSQSATPVATVSLRKLPDRYDDLTISIEAVNDDGAPITGLVNASSKTRAPLLAQVKVSTRKSCGGDAGADGG